MKIIATATRLTKTVSIQEAIEDDFRVLTRKRYYFDWKQLKHTAKNYVLRITGTDDIIGVLAIIDFTEEKRIEIKLLACSAENTGKNKIYEGIGGCLIAYACRLAKTKYGDLACVSLIPKTSLKQHYIKKYLMIDAGWQLFLEGKCLNDIIIKYLS